MYTHVDLDTAAYGYMDTHANCDVYTDTDEHTNCYASTSLLNNAHA